MECHSTANGMSIDCQWSVTHLPPTDIPVTFEWQSSGSWMSLECHSNLFVCLFVYLFVCLFVQVTFKWHSSGIQWHSSDIPMALEWHSIGSVSFNLSYIPVAVEWHSSNSPMAVEWHSIVSVSFKLSGSPVTIQWQSSDISVTVQWQLSGTLLDWQHSGSQLAMEW